MKLQGKVFKYGDNINTDLIIAGKYTKTLDKSTLPRHVMEDLDADFVKKIAVGDFVVGGKNFGCGSSREQAPVALKMAGVSCVIAESFARIFYRNAINIGLPLVECPVSWISNEDSLEYDMGTSVIKNLSTGESHSPEPLPEIMIKILQAGGLVAYIKENGNL